MMISNFYRAIILLIATLMFLVPTKASSTSTTRYLKKGQGDDQGNKGNSGQSPPDASPPRRRMTLEARATLENLDIDEMAPEQVVFFETTFFKVFNELQADQDDEDGNGLVSDRSLWWTR
jgi:hypothetical protein